jgi:uncharacterized protein YlxP (DUF503 family)
VSRRGGKADTGGIWVGVLRMEIVVPGARTLKDRRQGVLSVRDRLRHRLEVTVNEVESTDDPQRQPIVCTAAGNDQRSIRTILDRAVSVVREHAAVVLGQVDLEVFRWQAPEQGWAARMMDELGTNGTEDDDG